LDLPIYYYGHLLLFSVVNVNYEYDSRGILFIFITITLKSYIFAKIFHYYSLIIGIFEWIEENSHVNESLIRYKIKQTVFHFQ